MKKQSVILLLIALLMAFGVGGAAAQDQTIVDIAAGNPDFSTLVTAVQAAGLVDVLADPNAQWTVFAPTNAAFEALPEGVLDMVLADQELLTRILTYHVVQGAVTSDQLSSMMVPSMEMTALGADLAGSELDIQVGDDGSVTVNGANVVTADIIASNGVIHVVDAVLLPPDVAAALAGDGDAATEEAAGTIVDIAAGNPDFSTLVTAVQAAGLVDVLADPNAQWTVFAPTNAAFEALPEGVLDMVLADQELLTRILTYHVVQGAVTSDQLSSMMVPSMEMTALGADLAGSELDIQVGDDGSVTVNGANVVTADIIASNGVIHVVDAVLLPPDVAAALAGDGDAATEEPAAAPTGDAALFISSNPDSFENDSVVTYDFELSGAGRTFNGFEGIASVQSVDVASDGTAYVTADLDASSGGIIVIGGMGAAESMAVGAAPNIIGGPNAAGLIAPKGLDVVEELGVVIVANFGANNIKGFPLDATGDATPTIFIDNFGGVGGGVWDVHYDAASDTLFAAGTAGSLLAYGNFSTDFGRSGPTATIVPSDADGSQISVNLHGVDYDAASDTIVLTDVGAADNNTDGQIFVIAGVTGLNGNVPVTAWIGGEGSQLGNPVDVALRGNSIYVAEKANDLLLRYDNILGMTGMSADPAPVAVEFTRPESVSVYDAAAMTDEMAATEEAAGTIVDIAAGNPDFSTLVTAVQAAGLVDVLADPNAQWTVFAPTNAAFEALPEGVLDMVLADQELLTRILTYHVVQGAVTSDQLSSMMVPSMEMTALGADLAGSELDIQVGDDGSVTVNGANVVTADIIASNGVIHVVDAVLLPPDVAAMVAGN